MSTPYSFQIPAAGGPTTPSGGSVVVPAGGTSPAITIGHNQLVRIAVWSQLNVRFGKSLVTANANDIFLLPTYPEIFDMGRQNEQIMFYNPSAANVVAFYSIVSRT